VSTKHAWERLERESTEAFAAFAIYRDMGRDRTIEAAFNKHKDDTAQIKRKSGAKKQAPNGTWTAWTSEHRWVERARAYDEHNDRIELEARAAERAKIAAKLEARRLEQREREWELSQQLQDKAKSLITQSLEARAGDSARLAEAGSRLARLSVGMETDHQKITGGASSALDIDLSDKDDDQLRAYLGGLAEAAARLASGV
jgi:hypothetical protein